MTLPKLAAHAWIDADGARAVGRLRHAALELTRGRLEVRNEPRARRSTFAPASLSSFAT